jgi:hypothetical protein
MDKIAKEVAELEFERFASEMDLDVSTDGLDEEEQSSLDEHRRKVVNSICNGSLVINEDGEPVYTPRRGENKEPLTFHEPTGSTIMAMDKKKKSEEVGKMYSVMAALTKQHPSTFSKMKYSDVKICSAITTLFLG